jgi:hypothetical protein
VRGAIAEHSDHVLDRQHVALLERALSPEEHHLAARVVGVGQARFLGEAVVATVAERLVLDANAGAHASPPLVGGGDELLDVMLEFCFHWDGTSFRFAASGQLPLRRVTQRCYFDRARRFAAPGGISMVKRATKRGAKAARKPAKRVTKAGAKKTTGRKISKAKKPRRTLRQKAASASPAA